MPSTQTSFIDFDLDAYSVNAVDGGYIKELGQQLQCAAASLAASPVDDFVFGLGFTNWKKVVDHALKTNHFELYNSEDNRMGLRKRGYKYAPIPRLPLAGAVYVKQQLLGIASKRMGRLGRTDRMYSVTQSLSFKVYLEQGAIYVTIKHDDQVIRFDVPIDQLCFKPNDDMDVTALSDQFSDILCASGVLSNPVFTKGCTMLAKHLIQSIKSID